MTGAQLAPAQSAETIGLPTSAARRPLEASLRVAAQPSTAYNFQVPGTPLSS